MCAVALTETRNPSDPSLHFFHHLPKKAREIGGEWKRWTCVCVCDWECKKSGMSVELKKRHFIIFGISMQWCSNDWRITLTNWSSFIQINHTLCYSSQSDVDVWHRREGMFHLCFITDPSVTQQMGYINRLNLAYGRTVYFTLLYCPLRKRNNAYFVYINNYINYIWPCCNVLKLF